MKWVFLLALIVMTPALAAHLRGQPRHILPAGFMLGLLIFLIGPLDLYVAPISWAGWPGPVKGLEVSVLDGLAVAIIAATRPIKTPLMLKLALGIYAIAILVSTLMSGQYQPCIFYAWQLFRAVLVYQAVARATAGYSDFPIRVLYGLGLGLAFEAFTATSQYIGGDSQAGGHFGHQNLLGMASLLVALPIFALLLAGHRTKFAIGILVCEAVIVFAGGSRAAIGLFGIGLFICIFLSIWHRSSGRKTMICGLAFLGLACTAPVMMLAVERRSEQARLSSNEEREQFNKAARMIIADHPLGVGANRYVIVANLGGYSERAGVPWNVSERSAPVHNFYYLVAAELGLLGFIGLIALLAGIILTGIRALKRVAWSERSELLVGVTASAIVASGYFAFEWVAMTFHIHYLFAINTGMLVALAAAHQQIAPGRRNQRAPVNLTAVQEPT